MGGIQHPRSKAPCPAMRYIHWPFAILLITPSNFCSPHHARTRTLDARTRLLGLGLELEHPLPPSSFASSLWPKRPELSEGASGASGCAGTPALAQLAPIAAFPMGAGAWRRVPRTNQFYQSQFCTNSPSAFIFFSFSPHCRHVGVVSARRSRH